MRKIKYILVSDSAAKSSNVESDYRDVPNIGHCVVVNCGKFAMLSGEKRKALTDQLVRLRNHYPETPILGWSELDTSYEHAPVRVNPEMNVLRYEMSGFP